MDAELLRYVKRALRKGYEEQRIVHQLTQQGWSEREARQAIHEAKASDSSGGVIMAALLIGLVAGAGLLTWFLLPDGAEPAPETNQSLNDSSSNLTDVNTSNNTNTSDTYLVSECEKRESQQEKFTCYQSKLRDDIGSVECIQLPQPDRRLCTHAYQSVTA